MQTVGEILRVEREKKLLSIKDVEAATSIRALYLTAIEETNYSIVPGEVYLKGFIRNYANHLGLDGQQMIDLYRENQLALSTSAADSKLSSKAKTTDDSSPSRRAVPEHKQPLRWLPISIVVVCILGAFWLITANRDPAQAPIPEGKSAPTVPVQPMPQTTTETKPSVPAKPVVVVAKFTEECWTLVSADGKNLYEGIPKAGETFTWEAQKTIVVKLGNAAGVDIVYNGQPLGKLGQKGEVVIKTFNAKL